MTLRKCHFYGQLAEITGPSLEVDVRSPAELVRALKANFGQRVLEIIRNSDWQILTGDRSCARPIPGSEKGWHESLAFHHPPWLDFHLLPRITGAGGGGGKSTFGIIAGVALLTVATAGAFGAFGAAGFGAAAFGATSAITYGTLAMAGGALLLSGVSGMLGGGGPNTDGFQGNEQPDARKSFIFSGAINSIQEGGPVGVVYGRMIVGSTVVSSAIEAVDV